MRRENAAALLRRRAIPAVSFGHSSLDDATGGIRGGNISWVTGVYSAQWCLRMAAVHAVAGGDVFIVTVSCGLEEESAALSIESALWSTQARFSKQHDNKNELSERVSTALQRLRVASCEGWSEARATLLALQAGVPSATLAPLVAVVTPLDARDAADNLTDTFKNLFRGLPTAAVVVACNGQQQPACGGSDVNIDIADASGSGIACGGTCPSCDAGVAHKHNGSFVISRIQPTIRRPLLVVEFNEEGVLSPIAQFTDASRAS
jgi:hypothetical protein